MTKTYKPEELSLFVNELELKGAENFSFDSNPVFEISLKRELLSDIIEAMDEKKSVFINSVELKINHIRVNRYTIKLVLEKEPQ